MAQATSISLSKFTASVQAAVKAAVAKHPKFKVDPPHAISLSYIIRGIPIPDPILAHVTVSETQAFANEIASHIGGAQPEVMAATAPEAAHAPASGAVLSIGGHVIIGIPPLTQTVLIEK